MDNDRFVLKVESLIEDECNGGVNKERTNRKEIKGGSTRMTKGGNLKGGDTNGQEDKWDGKKKGILIKGNICRGHVIISVKKVYLIILLGAQ